MKKLALHIKGTINTYFDYPFVNWLMYSLGTIDDGKYEKEIANKFARPIMEFQKKVLKEGEAQGIFRKVDPKLLSFHIAGACDYRGSSKGRNTIDRLAHTFDQPNN